MPKRRFSQFAGEASCNQECTSGLEQRLDDEAEPIITQGETFVLQHPSVAALHRPAPLAQPRAVRPTPLVQAGLGTEVAAEITVGLGIITLVGEHGPDADHDGKGVQEQALEQHRVIDVGRGHGTGDRHAITRGGEVVLGALLAAIGRVGAGQIAATLGPHRTAVEDQVGMAPQHRQEHGVYLLQQVARGPVLQPPAQGRAAGLLRRGCQAAPGGTFTNELPQGGEHADGVGRRVTAPLLMPTAAGVHHRCDQVQGSTVHARLHVGGSDMGVTTSRPKRQSVSQPMVVVKTASKRK